MTAAAEHEPGNEQPPDIAALLVEVIYALRELRDAIAPKEFMTDAEIIRRLGVPEKIAYQTFHALDHNPLSGFPKKIEHWGNRRRWPKVKEYLERTTAFPQQTRRSA